MKIVDQLLEAAYQDTQLLVGNDEKGDDFSIPRDVDFVFYAPTLEKAELVANFINDNQYGYATCEVVNGSNRVLVVVNMPTTQNLLCAVSGLMVCISALFDIEYDGWGCELQRS